MVSVLNSNQDWITDYILAHPNVYGPYRNTKGQINLSPHFMAQILAKVLQRNFRYCIESDQWYEFKDVVWKQIPSIYNTVLAALEEIRNTFRDRPEADQDNLQRMFIGIDTLLSNNYVYLVIGSLQLTTALFIKEEEFDTNPEILNTPDGTYNLLTGESYPNDPADFCRQITEVAPIDDENGGNCPHYMQHKAFMSDGRGGYDNYLEELSGYICTGFTKLKEFYWWYGFRDTGKSSLANVWMHCLGDYAEQGDQEQFAEKQQSAHRQLEMRLRNKRFVFVDEMKGNKLDGAKIKSFTSGGKIVANNMRENSQAWRPICKILIASNHYMSADAEDTGLSGRLRLAEFLKEIPEDNRVGGFEELYLRPEAPYILFRMIKYASKVLKQGCKLLTPNDILETTKTFLDENDVVAKMLGDCTLDNEYSHILNKDIVALATIWGEESGYDMPSKAKLLKLIKSKNKRYASYRSSAIRGIAGLELKSEWKQKIMRSANYG